jgi:trk system potassium uptake protein TrkH
LNLLFKQQIISNLFRKLLLALSIIAVFAVLYDLGFPHSETRDYWLSSIYALTLATGILSTLSRYIKADSPPRISILVFDMVSIFFFLTVLGNLLDWFHFPVLFDILVGEGAYLIAMLLVFIREYSTLKINFRRTVLNPAQLFILSFLFIIFLGAILLVLPKATYSGISFIDALFTSTSAVCVTGLIVVDTGSYFTEFGQFIILIFIQLGGLGIMTFASYFSYFFQGGASYENQLVLRDMSNSEKLGEVFSTLKRILLITFIIEALGALFIFISIDASLMTSLPKRSFFAIFHSISGFCNAGFSTLPNGMYEEAFRFNYPMHLILAGLYIVGGIGFPIVFNLVKYLKHYINKQIFHFFNKSKNLSRPWVINLNTRIVLITSSILTVLGTVFFFALEYNNTLAEHSFSGKWIVAFFNSTTTRTAGFNSIDMTQMRLPTIMVFLVLMWIGASPSSTGGGIKTSTIAIASLNFISIARGKDRIEIYRREIADVSVRRAFAIISLSLIIIGLATSILVTTEEGIPLIKIAFECFSAYSTVGLSLGITASMSTAGKIVLMFVMFIGRVSMLSILIALMTKIPYKNYRYPTEQLLIN